MEAVLLTIIAFFISFFISWIIGKQWLSKFRIPNEQICSSSEAYRSPINTGLSIAGILLPICVTIVSYLKIEEKANLSHQYYLYSSIILLIISIFTGLFNIFSLATITNENNTFLITKNNNTFFPAFFVFQFNTLIFAFIYIGFFGLVTTKSTMSTSNNHIKTEQCLIPIMKDQILIKHSKDDIYRNWGTPSESIYTGNTQHLIYHTLYSTIDFELIKDSILSITEKQK